MRSFRWLSPAALSLPLALLCAFNCLSAGAQQQTPAKRSCTVRTGTLSPGDIAMARRDFDKAVSLYTGEANAPAPEGARAHAALIAAMLEQDKLPAAEADARAWLASDPNDSWPLVALAEVQYRKAEMTPAYEALGKAVALDPCNAQAYFGVGRILSLNAMYASAAQEFALAHQLDPLDPAIELRWISFLPAPQALGQLSLYVNSNSSSFVSDQLRARLSALKDQLAASPDDRCHLASSASSTAIPFRRLQNGLQGATHWGLTVGLNGKERGLEIDSGASGLILSHSAATALHLTPIEQSTIGGIGDEGRQKAFRAKIDSIRIGGLEFRNCQVEVMEDDSKFTDLSGIDGLIGTNVFGHFLVTLDFPGHQLHLDALPPRPAQPAQDQTLATVSAQPLDLPQNRYIAPEMKNWTQIYRIGHDLLVPTRFNDSRPYLMILDTGAYADLLSSQVVPEVSHLQSDSARQINGLSGEVKKVYQTDPISLTFGGIKQAPGTMTAIDTSRLSNNLGLEVAGFLGSNTLHLLTVQIDYRDNLVHLTYDPSRLQHCLGGNSLSRGRDLPDCVK
jgi:predicted aspartyl protease